MSHYQRYARLRFSQLEMVCAVADCGSVRLAATRLHLSAAAVSKALREIESLLDAVLFERLPRGMIPTSRGERLIAHARLLLQELQGLAADGGDAKPLPGARLALGASPYIVARVLPQLLSALPRVDAARLPLVVRVSDGHLSLLLEQLLLGQIEALITLYAAGDFAGTNTEPLVVERLREEEVVVLAAPALCPPVRRRLPWSELLALPWILPPASTHLRRAVDGMFHLAGVQPPQPAIEATHLDGNVRLSAAGLGLTIAPLELAREHLAAARLHVLRLQQPLPASSLALIYRRASAAHLPGLHQLRAAARQAFATR
ncbi:LysR family transcriptional regulator [Ramlibacter sp. AN1015]|uniref:LysR family transcriptional regulator n=1 Tax=Ramlibacter sp. AN1015 TaxID=3133428 RepID=UPI0030BFD618